jgi:hypothetical protein
VEEVQQVLGILAGGIATDDDGDGPPALAAAFQLLAEAGVAVRGFGEERFARRGLQSIGEKGSVVSVARGVDADTAASGRLRSGRRLW